ncbi:MAG: tetratricopeptide repeat protein [Pyrinomonadaceae bacterium]
MPRPTSLSHAVATIAFILSSFLIPNIAQTTPSQPIDVSIQAKNADIGHSDGPLADDHQRSAPSSPNDAVSQNNLGAEYFRQGRYDEALDLITKAAESNPEIWNIQLNASILLSRKGDYPRALIYAQAASKLAPKELRVRQQLCDVYLAVQDGQSAAPCFDDLVKENSGDVLDLLGYGEALILNGAPAQATNIIREVIRASPRLAVAYNALGLAEYESRHYREAVDAFREAVSLVPGDGSFRYNMAIAEMARSDRAGAISQYNFLKGSDPHLADKLYQLMFTDQVVSADR